MVGFLACSTIPLKEKQSAENAMLECYEFSKEYAAITLNMAEGAMIKAQEALKNGDHDKAKKYFITAKEKYYQAKIETLTVQNRWLKDILDELVNAEKTKEKILNKIKDNKCHITEDILFELQNYISTGDRYFLLLLMHYSEGDLFEVRKFNGLPTQYYEKAWGTISNIQLTPCKN